MKDVNQQPGNAIYEFELVLNSTPLAANKAFNFYGILVIPTLLGAILMYHGLGLRAEYLLIAVLMLSIGLANLYFFNEKQRVRDQHLRLLVDGSFIQILSSEKVYLHRQIEELVIVHRYVQQYPTLEIGEGDLASIYISLCQVDKSVPLEKQLRQPDYWIESKTDWHRLCQLM
ncbi:MAG: hypothetical protein AAF990_24770 [Bacteroidota bacterium]